MSTDSQKEVPFEAIAESLRLNGRIAADLVEGEGMEEVLGQVFTAITLGYTTALTSLSNPDGPGASRVHNLFTLIHFLVLQHFLDTTSQVEFLAKIPDLVEKVLKWHIVAIQDSEAEVSDGQARH